MKQSILAIVTFVLFYGMTASSEDSGERVLAPNPKSQTRRRISSVFDPPSLNPSQETQEKMNDPEEPFSGYWMRHSIGLEGGLPLPGTGTSNTTVFSSPAVAYGLWTSPTSGWEFYFGTSKTADSISTSETVTNTYSGTTLTGTTEATTFTGPTAGNPRSFVLGLAYKYRIYQVKHFGLSTDFLATFIPQRAAGHTGSGTRTVTTADVNTPSNYTVNEADILDYDTTISSAFGFGPRFNIEYNFPYVPNLLIGVSTGIFVNFGGETTTVRTRTNKSTTYTGGVAGTPTYNASHGETVTTVTSPGNSGGTYGIGGSGFTLTGAGGLIPLSVNGTFRLRYAF